MLRWSFCDARKMSDLSLKYSHIISYSMTSISGLSSPVVDRSLIAALERQCTQRALDVLQGLHIPFFFDTKLATPQCQCPVGLNNTWSWLVAVLFPTQSLLPLALLEQRMLIKNVFLLIDQRLLAWMTPTTPPTPPLHWTLGHVREEVSFLVFYLIVNASDSL